MPELPPKTPPIIAQFPSYMRRADSYQHDNILLLSEKHPEAEIVGFGGKALVLAHPTNPEKVIAYYVFNDYSHRQHVRALEVFNFHKIYHTLFPHNFPRISFVSSSHDPSNIRQRVKTGGSERVDYPFSQVRRVCADLGLPLFVNNYPSDFGISAKDRGEHYLDIVSTPNQEVVFRRLDMGKLASFMDRQQLSEQEKRAVYTSLRRLWELEMVRAILAKLEETDSTNQTIEYSWVNNHLSASDTRSRLSSRSLKNISRFLQKVSLPQHQKPKLAEVISSIKVFDRMSRAKGSLLPS